MAALRLRKVRVITPEESEKYDRWLKKGIKRGRTAEFGKRLPGKTKYVWEIVATTPEEAASGLFKPVGDLLVFIPSKSEDVLWQRLRTMDQPEHRDLWYHPYYGIKAALRKTRMEVPTSRWKRIQNFPAGIIDLEFHDIVPTGKDVDPITGEVHERTATVRRRPYEAFIREVWIKKWLYSSAGAKEGQFSDTRRAQAVASAFGITIDKAARAPNWFRTGSPDVTAEAERNIVIPEDTFQDEKQRMISTMEILHSRGRPFDPDWSKFSEAYRAKYGVMGQAFIDRMRVELEPVIRSLHEKAPPMQENSQGAYPRKAPKRPSRVHSR